jgi:hypothetical protein
MKLIFFPIKAHYLSSVRQILRFHVVNLIILFIARLMAICAPMATINMRSRTTDYTSMARVAQKWLQLKKNIDTIDFNPIAYDCK